MAAMQFWGIEVKGKEPSKVKLEEGHLIHLSQAALGEQKKDGEPVILHVKVDGKKLVLGILNSENNPQLSFDLVFEKDFEISHNWKNGSVHLLGYQSEFHDEGDEDESVFTDEDEDMPIPQKENGEAAAAVTKAIAAKPHKDNKPKPEAKAEDDDDDDDDSDGDEDSEDDESDEDMLDMSDDSDDNEGSEDDEESSEEEEPAKAAESGKKRKAEAKTPEPKKAKAATPQKTDGKNGGHTATPHPAKKGGNTPGGDKSTPKSSGQVSCGPCKKTFNSEVALQSHTKAKHSGK